jgi:hypothetical protein
VEGTDQHLLLLLFASSVSKQNIPTKMQNVATGTAHKLNLNDRVENSQRIQRN